MTYIVSDANIFIDMDTGDLTRAMFRTEITFATPDVLYVEELEEHHAELPGFGLRIEQLSSDGVSEVERLASIYSQPSINDLFALVLAKERQWQLLSGDARLRAAAESEDITVRGTLWLIEKMVVAKIINVERAKVSFEAMRDGNRRLPWTQVDQMIERLQEGK